MDANKSFDELSPITPEVDTQAAFVCITTFHDWSISICTDILTFILSRFGIVRGSGMDGLPKYQSSL